MDHENPEWTADDFKRARPAAEVLPQLIDKRRYTMYTTVIDDEAEELDDMGSFNHGYVQVRLIVAFDKLGVYTPVTELSLDVSGADLSQFDLRTKEEIKPDICLYPKRGLSRPRDILKMTEMPLLAVEILSPRQGTYSILQKFEAYFSLGIHSCWLVEPTTRVVHIYKDPITRTTYSTGDLIDEKLDIQMAVAEIFE